MKNIELFYTKASFLWVIVFLGFIFFANQPCYSIDLFPSKDRDKDIYDQPFSFKTFREVASQTAPSVVNISTTTVIKKKGLSKRFYGPFNFPEDPFSEFFGDDFWKRFFQDVPSEQTSLGSGVIWTEDGYIITNNHVVEQADKIRVTLMDKSEYDAEIVGTDAKTDLALIKIKPDKKLQPAKLGDSDAMMVGDWVIAIGNPFGLDHTVTVGVISAKGRVINLNPTPYSYEAFLQTDASINPGNSGGPLINLYGEVIGINTAILSKTGGFQGIGFAIPINMAKEVLPQLKDKGKVSRGWLGVSIQMITDSLAKSLKLKDKKGALVSEIIPNSPADKAGFKRSDVIIEFDGKPIESFEQLPWIVATTPIGKKVEVKIIRDGKEKVLEVKIGEQPSEGKEFIRSKSIDLGISVQDLTPEIAENLGLDPETKGVVINDVDRLSPSYQAGLRRGDVIVEINRQEVRNIDDYENIVDKIKPGETVLFLIQRQSGTVYVAVEYKNKEEK